MSSLSSALRFELAAAAAAAKNNWLARKLSGYPTSFVYLLLLLLLLLSWLLLASNGASQRGACYADPEGTLFSAVATKCARKRAKCAPKSTQFCSNLTTLADRIGSVRFGSDRIGSARLGSRRRRSGCRIKYASALWAELARCLCAWASNKLSDRPTD